jgi:hypothetical protein
MAEMDLLLEFCGLSVNDWYIVVWNASLGVGPFHELVPSFQHYLSLRFEYLGLMVNALQPCVAKTAESL